MNSISQEEKDFEQLELEINHILKSTDKKPKKIDYDTIYNRINSHQQDEENSTNTFAQLKQKHIDLVKQIHDPFARNNSSQISNYS